MSYLNMFDFSGDPGAPERFYDEAEFNRSKQNRDRYLGDVKKDRTRYRGLRDTYSGRETGYLSESDRLYGLGEKAIDSSGRFITKANRFSRQAGDLASGDDYRTTAEGIQAKTFDLDRIQGKMGGIRRAMGQRLNIGNSKFSAIARDALTSWYQSQREELDTQLAGSSLAPAAQQALKERLARGAAENVTKAEIQGLLSEEDADMRRFLNEAQLLGSEFNMARAGIESLVTQQDARRAQQRDLLNAASGQLNVAGQQMNQGGQYMNLGQGAFRKAGYVGDASRFYEGAQQQMTGELLDDSRERMGQQQQLKMQDAANQEAYNTYKAQSGQRGFNNLMKAAQTAARVYMAFKTAGMSELAAAGVDAAAKSAGSNSGSNSGGRPPQAGPGQRGGAFRSGSYSGSGGSHGRSRSLSLGSRDNYNGLRYGLSSWATPGNQGSGGAWAGNDLRRFVDKNSLINDIQF